MAITTDLPDLTKVPLDELVRAPSGLAKALALYRERLKADGVPLSSFNARI